MKPAIRNGYIRYDKNGRIVGIKLGANEFSTEPFPIETLITNLSQDHKQLVDELGGVKTLPQSMRYNKRIRQDLKLLERWKNTPYSGYVLNPHASILTKKITIDNTTLYNNFNYFLCENGSYDLILISHSNLVARWKTVLGKRRIFNEGEILDIKSYNNGFNPAHRPTIVNDFRGLLVGAWGTNSILLLIRNDKGTCVEDFSEVLTKELRGGNIAVVESDCRVFGYEKGCCLLFLDRLYYG